MDTLHTKYAPITALLPFALFAFLISPACSSHLKETAPPQAVRGVLDLSDWSFKTNGPITLAGEFAFYWMQHLDPLDFSTLERDEDRIFVKVPAFWNRYELGGRRLSGDGYATYSLKVLLHETNPPLAIKFLGVGTAYTLYLNGEKVTGAGIPGRNLDSTVPRYFPHVFDLRPESPHLDMVFHVSNFHHRRGGLWDGIQLGSEKDIRNIREGRLGLDLFLLGSIFMIGLYHLGLFLLRKKERSALYFCIVCFLIALRLLTTEEKYIIHILPNMEWEIMLRLEYFTIYLSVPMFILFMYSLFPQEFSPRPLKIVILIFLILSAIALALSPKTITQTLPVFYLIVLMTCFYMLYVTVLAIYRKREGSLIFLIGFVFLPVTVINDMLHTEHIVHTEYLAPAGFFIFLFSQAFLISRRFSRAFTAVKEQHLELRDTLHEYRKEITDRKRTEEALHESEEKYRNILKGIEEGYYEVDLAGNMLFFNDSMCEILGYPDNELMGMNNRQYTSEETGRKMYETFNEVFRTGKATKAFDWEAIRKDGSTRYLELSIRLMRDGENNPIGFRGIVRDMTEKKRVEAQARLHQQQLMQTSKMVALGTLVSGVAHEINNPNNFIMLNAPLLKESWNDIHPILEKYYKESGDFVLGGMKYSEIRHSLHRLYSGILDGSKRIKQIVDDLKNYVRKDTSDLTQEVDLNAVLKSAVSLMSNAIKKATHNFRADYGIDLPILKGNFQQLEQVLINLIQNACQALSDPNKGINASTAFHGEDQCIVVIVRDEGLGIAADSLPYITDPFFTTKGDSGGVGLGLSISSRIIEQHGGSMVFNSKLGKGTTVEIYLPVNRDPL